MLTQINTIKELTRSPNPLFNRYWCLTCLISIFLFILLIQPGLSQGKTVDKSFQQWFQYVNPIKLSDKWSLHNAASYRSKDKENSSLYLIRTGFVYDITDAIAAGGGFAHYGYMDDSHLNRFEYRPHQEFLMKMDEGSLGIRHRLRVEERIITNAPHSDEPEPNTFNFRFRYQLAFNIPVLKLSSLHPDRRLFLNFGDELFLNSGHQVVYDIFDQNRLVLGSTAQLNNTFAIWFAYNYQFKSTDTPDTYLVAQVIRMGLTHKMDLTNKNEE